MKDIWPKRTEVTVTMNAHGRRFQALRVVEPEAWEIPELQEMIIRELKDAVLQEIGKQTHWRIDVRVV